MIVRFLDKMGMMTVVGRRLLIVVTVASLALLGPWMVRTINLNLAYVALARGLLAEQVADERVWERLERSLTRQTHGIGEDTRGDYALAWVAIVRRDPALFYTAASRGLLTEPLRSLMIARQLDWQWEAQEAATALASLPDRQVALRLLSVLAEDDLGPRSYAVCTTYARAMLNVDPASLEARRKLAKVLHGQGDYEGAIAMMLEVGRLGTFTADDCLLLGSAYSRMEQFDQVAPWLQRARELAPQDAWSLVLLGEIEWSQGHRAQAIALLEEAVCLDPDHPAANTNLGMYWQRAGQWDVALPQLERAVLLAPESVEAHGALALTLNHEGRYAEALPHAQYAWGRIPGRGDFLVALADAYAGLGQVEAAAAAYTRLRDFGAYQEYAQSRLKEFRRQP